MEKGRSRESPCQRQKSLPSTKKYSCDVCRKYDRRGSISILLEYTMEELLKKKPALHEFFRTINSLWNSRGGRVIIHLDCGDPDGSTRIDLLDQKVDEKLLKLLPGNYLYHEVYERYFIDSHHLLYRVMAPDETRPYSTLDFNSRFPVNRGLVEPSHDQIKAFIENIHDQPTTSRESVVLREVRQHKQPLIAKRQTALTSQDEREEVPETPFHESLSIQAKAFPVKGDKIQKSWELCKPYIPAFTKLPIGSSVFLGIQEEVTVHSETLKWTEVEEASQVTEFNIKFLDRDNKGYKIWKEEYVDDEPAYHIMKEDQVPKDERKSGRHVVQGIEEAEAVQIETNIKLKVTGDLKWVGVTEPRDVVTVKRLPVEGSTLQVIQVNISFYQGLCFDNPNGPEVYEAVFNPITGKKEIHTVHFSEWLRKYKTPSLKEF